MVSDLKKLKFKINSYLTNPKFFVQGIDQKTTEEKTAKKVDTFLKNLWGKQDSEKSFLTFFNDAGITLHKAADINNLDNWAKINYIPGAPLVTLTPCGFQKIKNPKSSK
jgi:N-glycosylase/DNA lyase